MDKLKKKKMKDNVGTLLVAGLVLAGCGIIFSVAVFILNIAGVF